MGDFKEHVLFGFLAAAVTAYFFKQALVVELTELVAASVTLFVGSVLPDIDNKNAYVHRSVKAFSSIASGIIVFMVFPGSPQTRFAASVAALLLVYAAFTAKKIRHRGFTHTVSFVVSLTSLGVIASVILFSSVIPGIALGVGLFSHLLLDGEISP